jgi:choline/glycine/proline betaine transport protein
MTRKSRERDAPGVTTRRLGPFPHVNGPVFLASAGGITVFVALGLIYSARMGSVAAGVHAWIAGNLGWFYTLSVALFPLVALYLALSRFGSIRLGQSDERPHYGLVTWFALLFSAGMGIGLLFWGVAEPLSHYLNPPIGQGATVGAGQAAMRLTYFHWGLHAWAIYVVCALGLAVFAFRYGLPLALRSALYPLIGERIYGPIGHTVDTLAVLGTLFGVATSLGLGVLQANAGLDYLFAIGHDRRVQVGLIALITAAATSSVLLGMDRGVARLSQLNLAAAGLLLLAVLTLGPTVFLLDAAVQGMGVYLTHLVQMSFWTQAAGDGAWQADWTLFYWGWWISWSPFVGAFIARVSRGRTIREFVAGVLLVPTAAVLVWMTVFGGTAIYLQHTGGAALAPFVEGGEVSRAFFQLLDALPGAVVTAAVATVVVVLFFVTSSDSGSLVIDTLTAGGRTDSPRMQRVFWAVLQGVVAATLLLGGGLSGLQTAAITTGLPMAAILVVLCIGLAKALARDHGVAATGEAAGPQSPASGG